MTILSVIIGGIIIIVFTVGLFAEDFARLIKSIRGDN